MFIDNVGYVPGIMSDNDAGGRNVLRSTAVISRTVGWLGPRWTWAAVVVVAGQHWKAIKCKFAHFLMQCDTCDECASINSSTMTRNNRKNFDINLKIIKKNCWYISNDVWTFVASFTIMLTVFLSFAVLNFPISLRVHSNRLSKERHKTFMFQWVENLKFKSTRWETKAKKAVIKRGSKNTTT